MNAILNRLQRLSDDELLSVSEAIDLELERRIKRKKKFPIPRGAEPCNGIKAIGTRWDRGLCL